MSTFIENLKNNVTALVSMKKVNSSADGLSKYQLEFAEKITDESNPNLNVLALVNVGDDRFVAGKGARRAWMTGTKDGLMAIQGLKEEHFADADSGAIVELNIIEPKIKANGQLYPLAIEIQETQEPNEYQATNLEKTAKQNGKDKYFVINGKYIFSNTVIVAGKANHKRITLKKDGQYLPTAGLIDFDCFDQVSTSSVKTSDEVIA